MAASPLRPHVDSLRVAMERLGIGRSDDTWLARISTELEALEEMVRKLDDLDLAGEEPANVFINRQDL